MAKIIVNNPKQVINGGAKKYYFKVKGLGGLKGDKGDKGDKGEDGKMPTIAQITGQSTTEVMSQKATTDALNTKQATISSSNKLSADLVDDTSTTNKFVTSEDKANWNAKQNTLTAGENIEISNDVIRAKDTTYTAGNGLNLNGTEFSANTDVLATKEDLDGYYTKPETDNLLALKLEAEVVAELPAIGEEGKLYLTPKEHTTQTATGNPITATVAKDAGVLESFQLDGDTFQQSYTGKNLVNTYDMAEITNSGLTITKGRDGAIILNGTQNESCNIRLDATDYFSGLVGENFTISVSTSGTGKWTNFGFKTPVSTIVSAVTPTTPTRTVTLETSSSGEYWFELYIENSGTVFNGYKVYIQVEKGSTATSYEPYVGGTPSPNPEYQQPIQTVTGLQMVEIQGKNLFNIATASDVWINTSGIALPNDVWKNSDFIKVEPNTTYTLSASMIEDRFHQLQYHEYSSNNESSYINQYAQINNTHSATFTTHAGCNYIRVGYRKDALKDLQLEAGSTASEYIPYSHRTLPIDLGTNELNNLGGIYLDYIYPDGGYWKLHKTTAKAVFKDIQWSTIRIGNTDHYRQESISIKTEVLIPTSNTKFVGACSDYTVVSAGDTYAYPQKTGVAIQFAGYSTSGNICVYDQLYDAPNQADNFKAARANAVIIYALATPTDTVITDQTLIAQLEAIRTASLGTGTNTITNTATGSNLAGDMEIGYYGYNPRNRYDKWLWLDIDNEYEQIGS